MTSLEQLKGTLAGVQQAAAVDGRLHVRPDAGRRAARASSSSSSGSSRARSSASSSPGQVAIRSIQFGVQNSKNHHRSSGTRNFFSVPYSPMLQSET